MDTSKFNEIFEPKSVEERFHIIGCGSVGSTIVELLARMGLTKFTLYDFDIVTPHNIANQMFFNDDIGKLKVEALRDTVCRINPEAKEDIEIEVEGWNGQSLAGYVILAVDNIEIRRKICEENKYNPFVKGVFDVRTGLYDAQHFAADWSNEKHKERLINTMNFSHEERLESTPMSACGITLGVAPTVRLVSCVLVTNLYNFITKKEIKTQILTNPFGFEDNTVMTVC